MINTVNVLNHRISQNIEITPESEKQGFVTDTTETSTQITSVPVVPGGLVEEPPFPGNLKICSSNHGGGTLTATTTRTVTV
jgi:hypothetical protein